MENDLTIMSFLSVPVAVVTALITAALTGWRVQKNIKVENITQERKVWRDKIRELALEVHDALESKDLKKLKRLRAAFQPILNSTDSDDLEILEFFDKCESCGYASTSKQKEFTARISLLLKHDWERVKREVSFLKKIFLQEHSRYSYEQWIENPTPKRPCKLSVSSYLIILMFLLLSIFSYYRYG